MEPEELLAEVGLTERETKVYLSLLELSLTTTGPLVKKSGVPNSKIYEILESLQNKGLVSWIIKGKTKYFQASEPKKILTLFKEKEREIESLIPTLEAKQLLAKEKQSTELFEGLSSIRSMFLELISDAKKGEDLYGFGAGETSKIKEVADFFEWWGARKALAGLKDHLLISLKSKKLVETIHKKSLDKLKKIMRYSKVSFPGDVAIFRDKVIILYWKENPTAILITSKYLAEQYKQFFLGLWESAK